MGNEKKKSRAKKHALVVFIAILLCLVAVYSFSRYRTDQELIPTQFNHPNGNSSVTFKLELAHTESKRRRGLMFVKEMGKNNGMLFIFPLEKEHSFFMKNTYIPLDMIFVDSEFKVVGVLHSVPPLNSKSRSVAKPSKYVIELNAGRAKDSGIVEGSVVSFGRALPVVVE